MTEQSQSTQKELFKDDDIIGGFRNHNIRNPYIIIIGISDYSQSKNITNLPAVNEDVENMYKLFRNEFGYRYVYKHLNTFKLKDKELEIKSRREFGRAATYHKEEIEKLEDTKEKIDAIIFIYSGHGDEGVILGNKGNRIGIPHIHTAFDNEELPFMENRPRLYIFDCCRGGDMEIGKHVANKKPLNVSKDTVYWYGSSEGMKAFERSDKKGSIFLTEIYTVLFYMLRKSKYWNLSSIVSTLVFKKVMKEKGENQTPEYKKLIGYEIYLVPSKTSKWNIEEEEIEINKQKSINNIDTGAPDLSTDGDKNQNQKQDTRQTEEQKREDEERINREFDDIYNINRNDKESIPYKEGFLFGGALGDFFISKIKGIRLKQGQISDITEMNMAMMYGIKNIIEYKETETETETENEQQRSTNQFKDENKENKNEYTGRNDNNLEIDLDDNYENGIIFDVKQIANEYLLWMKNNKLTNKFALGNTITRCIPKKTVDNMKNESRKMDKESKFGGTKSNGSLMRISPLILFLLSVPLSNPNDYQSIFLILKEDSELTHYNYTCHIINGVLFYIIQYLINNHKDENKHIKAIENGENFLKYLAKLFSNNKEKFKNYIPNLKEVKEWLLNGKQNNKDKMKKLSPGAFVRIAFEHMIFYLYNKFSIINAFKQLGQLGRRSDTAVCYIVGSVLGAYYGINKLPKNYIDKIKNYKPKDENQNKYQTFQYIEQKFIQLLNNNTRDIDTIRIYITSEKQGNNDNNNVNTESTRGVEDTRQPERHDDDDLFGGFDLPDDLDMKKEYVEYIPGMKESNFIKCLFYEEPDEETIEPERV